MNKLKKLKNNYKTSPSFIYFLLESKSETIAVVATFTFLFRFCLSSISGDNLTDAFSNALEFASILSASMIAVLLYFKDTVNKQLVKKISKKKHTVIFGLGEFSTALLDSELKSKNPYIIFEKDISSNKIEHFRKSGMGVLKGNAFDSQSLKELNFENIEYAMITLGSDRLNIELAIIIIEYYAKKKFISPIKLVVHIINQDLNTLFHQEFIQLEKKSYIDIQTFSFYEEAAASFIEYNFIDGEDSLIMQSDEEYNIIIVGDGELAINIIYQIASIAHLINENKLTIHLVGKDSKAFKNRVIKRYIGILHVVSLEAVVLDDETLEYYKYEKLWFMKNLTHVIVGYDDEEKNIELSTDLFNKTYLSVIDNATFKTRINFAIFNAYHLSAKIDKDKGSMKQFYSFANVKDICKRENLLDETNYLIAKLIHNQYANEYEAQNLFDLSLESTDMKNINEKWYNTSKLSDKLSSITQSKHLDIKLKALGLQRKKDTTLKTSTELLHINRKILDSTLKADRDTLGLTDTFLKEYSKELSKMHKGEEFKVMYFPSTYATTLEKLIRAEHNRWEAFHHLNGWVYNKKKNKLKKEHDCLIALCEFKKPKHQITVIYDIYSILYIPNYLANTGYEIKVLPTMKNI